MADDDKNIGAGGNIGSGDGADDPWAGLDSDAATNGNDSFEFPGFESLLDEPVADGEPVADAPVESVETVAPHFAPPVAESSAADAADVPAFDALSLGAEDGVFTDETAWNAGDPFAVAASEPSDEPEPPLAVFPPAGDGLTAEDPGIRDEDPGLLAGGEFPEGGEWPGVGDDADALAHLEDASDAEADPGIVAFAPPDAELPMAGGEFEAGESLVVGEAASAEEESLVGQSQIDSSAIQIGTGQSGILPFEDWGDGADATATDASSAPSGDDNPFGDSAFDADAEPVQVDSGFGDAAGLATGVGAAAVAAPARRVIKRRSGGGGIAAMVSVLLGGVLAIPITIAILFWGFKKDPFQIAPKIPASLAFLLPPQFQVAGQGGRTLPGVAAVQGTDVASRSVEDLVAEAATTEEPAPAAVSDGVPSEEIAVKDEPAAVDAGSETVASSREAVEPRRPPPLDAYALDRLDTSALDGAVMAADRVTARLLDASVEDPDYKKLLKDWYTALSKVGEETVSLEQQASDSTADFVAPAIKRTIGRILADERASEQFAKLSRMWLKSRGRTSDGVVLPATLVSSRKVGSWWVSRVRVSDDAAVPEVAVLSRSQPGGSEGDDVVVLGLVFEPGVVWAAACDRFEPVSGDTVEDASSEEPKASAPATGEELFPLE
jgi:hypothetical protein